MPRCGRPGRGQDKGCGSPLCAREVAQSCPGLCDPMDCSPPGFSIHGIFQARVLEWGAISFSRGSSQPRGLHCRQTPYRLRHQGRQTERNRGPLAPTVWGSACMVSLKLAPPASRYRARASTVATPARACRRRRGAEWPRPLTPNTNT